MKRSTPSAPLKRLTAAAVALALAPRLTHRGMFFDGVTYATLSRNLAFGHGRFWEPFYTETLLPTYHDNPPLALGLQSLWFRALGDHLYVERLYDAVCTAAVLILIVVIWKRVLSSASDHTGTSWLPVLLWITPPIASWTMVGNMLETTLIVFTTAAVAAVVVATRTDRLERAAAWGAVSGACIAAGALTKGLVALFPLAAPVLFTWSIGRTDRRAVRGVICVVGQVLVLSAVAIGLWMWPEARASLSAYVSRQLVPALSGATNPQPAPRFQVLSVLVQQVIVTLIVVSTAIVVLARGFVVPDRSERHWGFAFLTLGLAATLPIMVSTKQTGYYFAPAIPFYALGTAALMRRTGVALVGRMQTPAVPARAVVNGCAAVLAAGAIVGCVTGTGRDRVLLAELDRLEPVLPKGQTIRMCTASTTDWSLHAWFARRFQISLEPVDAPAPGFFLQTGGQPGCSPSACESLSKPDAWLVLRRCR